MNHVQFNYFKIMQMKTLKGLLIIAVYFLFSSPGIAQVTFMKQYDFGGDECAYALKSTADGGYIITGWKNSSLLLIKADEFGDIIWSKTLYLYNGLTGYDVIIAENGDYVVTGLISDLNYNADLFLARFNSNGDTLWLKKFGGARFEVGWGLCETSDGGFIATGQTQSVCDSSEVYIVKTDANGNFQWERTYCNTNLGWGNAIKPTLDGNFIISGLNSNKNWLLKINNNGDTLWTKTYGIGGLGGCDVIQNADGSLTVTGNGILKTDVSGNLIWMKPHGSLSFTSSNDNGYVGVTYDTDFFYGDQYIYMYKADNNGDSIWSRVYGFHQSAWGYCIDKTQDGGFIICGRIDPEHNGGFDVILIKTDANGLVVGLDEIENSHKTRVEISPNPFSDYSNIRISGIIPEKSSIYLYNVLGAKIMGMENIYSDNITIYRNNLPSGVYLLELFVGDKNMFKGKLIIN